MVLPYPLVSSQVERGKKGEGRGESLESVNQKHGYILKGYKNWKGSLTLGRKTSYTLRTVILTQNKC